MLCNANGAISHLQTEMGFVEDVTTCTIDENTFSAPFGIFYVRTEICKEIFQKSHIQLASSVPGRFAFYGVFSGSFD